MLKHYTTRPDHYFERPAEIELIRSMLHKPQPPKKEEPIGTPTDGFVTKKAADWLIEADKQPEARMLFDKFWYENELCILFADTNMGKSILAVQIADLISKGNRLNSFDVTAPASTVLYIDFELSAKQFTTRYSAGLYGRYDFGDKFLRASLNPNATGASRFSNHNEYLTNALENAILNSKAQVLIIDNITCLGTGTHASVAALNLMKTLQAIKSRYNISILVLAHTPKRNPARPITRNDLQGSKMLINFCDSAFAIGESNTHNGLRYLKQIKQRNTGEAYGEHNVCLCSIVKHSNFLHFEFTGFGHEADHLQPQSVKQQKHVYQKIMELNEQGLSTRKIAAELGVSASNICRIINRLKATGDAADDNCSQGLQA